MALATEPIGAAERARHPILVVSADATAREATVRTLRAAGFPVTEAASGAEGLGLAAEGFSTIVLDVEMPELDGFRFCRTLRANQNTAGLPVLFMSAPGVSSEHTRAALDAGADACLVYPVDPTVLLAMTQALVRARAAELAARSGGAAWPAQSAAEWQLEIDVVERAAWSLLERAVDDRTLAALNAILTSTRAQTRMVSEMATAREGGLGLTAGQSFPAMAAS